MSDPLIVIHEITKLFTPSSPPALDNISAAISKGKIIGIAGPDGAGKTTLIRLMASLLLPTKGRITIAGYDTVKDAAQISRLIGYMPQKFGLYEDLSVIQNLTLYADLQGVTGKVRQEMFDKLLTFTDLKKFQQRLAGALSGGMKQKLGLACALIRKPTLLLLDEPSVGVDPISRRELWKMVQSLLEESITVIWSTAYLDEAERTDSVILLDEGKLLFFGPPQDLTQRVKGKTFQIQNISGNRRPILKQALQKEEVIDGVIQGKDIRIVTRKVLEPGDLYHPLVENSHLDSARQSQIEASRSERGSPSQIGKGDEEDQFGKAAASRNRNFQLEDGIHLPAHQPLQLNPVSPRFEDAFIDMLGGGPGGVSALAEKTPVLPKKSEPIIQAEHLTKKFGDFTAARDITFTVPSGEIFGLLGPNGAGKSTTFKMLCGLLTPTSGKAFVNSLDLQTAGSEARSHIGYMAQKFSLYGNLSVRQNLDFFSGIYNLKGHHKRNMIEEMVETFALTPYLGVNADALPLGFKQRLALSCSVMHRPQVLFLDEPTSGVDPVTRREFWNHINGLVEKGVTVMVTTHFMDEAEYCDRIALIYQSQVIKIGTPDELKQGSVSSDHPKPTLEDAFIHLIKQFGEVPNATG